MKNIAYVEFSVSFHGLDCTQEQVDKMRETLLDFAKILSLSMPCRKATDGTELRLEDDVEVEIDSYAGGEV